MHLRLPAPPEAEIGRQRGRRPRPPAAAGPGGEGGDLTGHRIRTTIATPLLNAREPLTLAERLANTPTPAGPTPNELGGDSAFVSLTVVRESLRVPRSRPDGENGS